EKKDLFLFFGGSDWCPFSRVVTKGILSQQPFQEYVSQHYVVVELDQPRYKPKPENYPTHLTYASRWNITSCPRTVLADAQGRPYKMLGDADPKESVQQYLQKLDRLRQARATRDELLARAAQSQGVEKAQCILKALESLPPSCEQDFGAD